MTDRDVTVRLRADIGQYQRQLSAAASSTSVFARSAMSAEQGLATLGSTAGKIGLVAAAGVGAVVLAAANFDQAMSNVAATGDDARGSIDDLRAAAIKAGADTKFSAGEAAQGIEALAKAGVSSADTLSGGLSGALDLAAAGGLDVASAAEVAATALTQFKLAGEDVPHVADLLAAGAGKAQGDVSDLAMALKQGGLVAAQMGVSIEETTGVLAEFASAGLLGSDAGTSLKTMLLRLANPAKEASELMKSLGINAYDTQGGFVGLESLAGQLQTAFEGKTQAERDSALATIFGSDAIRAASVLYQGGADSVASWTDKVNDTGYAAETAAIKMDNLKGDLEQLRGSLETALIGGGEGAQGPLRGLVQGTTETVNALDTIPGPAKTAGTALLGLTAVLGASVWTGTKIVAGVASMKAALASLGIQASTTRSQLALVGTGGAAAALGIGSLLDAISMMDSRSRSNRAADATVQSIQDLSDALQFSNVGKYAADLGINLDRLAQDLAENGAQGEYAKRVLDDLGDSSHGFNALLKSEAGSVLPFYTDSASKAYDANKDLKAIIDEMGGSLSDTGEKFSIFGAIESAVGPAAALSGALSDVTEVNDEATKAIIENIKAMQDQADAAVGAFDAITNYRQAVKDAAEQAKKNNAGIAGSSKAMLANRDALGGLVAAWNGLDQTVTDNVHKFKEARDNFIKTAEGMGVSKKAASDLWHEMAKIPSSKVTQFNTPGADAAISKAKTLKQILDQLHSKDINIALHYQTIGNKPHAPVPGDPNSADGGTVPKSGMPYADRYRYLLADGEEVISNRHGQADRHRGLLKAINAGRMADGGTSGHGSRPFTLFTSGSQTTTDIIDSAHGIAQALKMLQAALAKSEKSLDKERQSRDDLQSQYDSIKSQVGSAYSTKDPFAMGTGSAWGASSGGLGAFDAALASNTANTQAAQTALAFAASHGLDGPLYAALAASGNLPLLQQFANLSSAEIDQREQAFAAQSNAQSALGGMAAQTEVGSQLGIANKNLVDIQKEVRQLRHDVKVADQNNQAAQKQNSKDVKDGVNGAAANGHKRGQR